MRKRHTAEYHEPDTLGDLRRIVADHEGLDDKTRIWIRHEIRAGFDNPNEVYVISVFCPSRGF